MSGVRDLYRARDEHVVVNVHVHPAAGRTAVAGRHGDALKLKVAAPPTGGRANDAVVALLAETLGVEARAVSVVSGATSRVKGVRVDGIEPAVLDRALEAALERAGNAPRGARR